MKQKQKIFAALSGGVDSAVAAKLLVERGYEVVGIHMGEWVPEGISCQSADDRRMAMRVAASIGIPFAVWDFRGAYQEKVAAFMISEYAAGRTPNPDVMCNKEIKFGLFLEKALLAGADFIATGHYIKVQSAKYKVQSDNLKSKIIYTLHKAKDSNKDQSYFLWTLTQDQLQYCLFPLGEYTKPEVRVLAKKFCLPNWDRKDSQGVCFTGDFDFGAFLRRQIPQREGVVVTPDGQEIGRHDGAQFYTLGQRHGILVQSLPAGRHGAKCKVQSIEDTKPVYVARKDITTNTIVAALEDDPALYKTEFVVRNVHWISDAFPKMSLECDIRIRYRQPLQRAIITILLNSRSLIHTDTPQRAVTPGQSVVFYKGKEMLGGGIIA